MSLIQFKNESLAQQWYNEKIDRRLQFILRSLADYMGGIRITCLGRTEEENRTVGGNSRSKHLFDPKTGLCQAADVNPPHEENNPDRWRMKANAYLQNHLNGIDTDIRKHGTAPHLHIEIDIKVPGMRIELI